MAASSRFRAYLLNQARQNLAGDDYGSAFSHYLLAVKMDHDLTRDIHDEIVSSMRLWTDLLHATDQREKLSAAFSQARAVLCFSDTLMCALGEQAFRLEELCTALSLMEEANLSFPLSISVQETLEHVSYGAVERWHFKMLNDWGRNKAYNDAIVSTLQKYTCASVLDIGCGTGLLSVFAARGGAKTVTLCDDAPVMTKVCSAVMASHHQQTQSSMQYHIFDTRSTSLSVPEHIPERVDLVVTEIFDAALFGEHCVSTLNHAWSQLLQNSVEKRSRVIPGAAQLYVSAIECPEIRKENCVHPSNIPVLDLGGICILSRTCTEEEPYTTEDLFSIRHSYKFLSSIHPLMTVDFNDPENLRKLSHYTSQLTLDMYAEGTVDALAVWFDLDLCDGIKVSTAPSAHCCWEQAIFPVLLQRGSCEGPGATAFLASPSVKCGDQLKITCKLTDGCLRLTVDGVEAMGYFSNLHRISAQLPDSAEDACHGSAQIFKQNMCCESGEENKLNTDKETKHVLDVEMSELHLVEENSFAGDQLKTNQISTLQNNASCDGDGVDKNAQCDDCLSEKEVSQALSQSDDADCLMRVSAHTAEGCKNDVCEQNKPQMKNMNINSKHKIANKTVHLPKPYKDNTDSFLINGVYTTDDNETPTGGDKSCNTEMDYKHRALCSLMGSGGNFQTSHTNDKHAKTDSITEYSVHTTPTVISTDSSQRLIFESQPGKSCTKAESHPHTICLHREEIRHLNDSKYNKLYLTALQQTAIGQNSHKRMFHVSTSLPLHGLLGLKFGVQQCHLCYMGHSESQLVKDMTDYIAECNGLTGKEWKWCEGTVEDVVEEHGIGVLFDVVSMDVVEMAGCLRGGLMNELRALRSAVSKRAVMIPQAVNVFAVLIDSPQLLSMSCVTCDENTLGVNIAPHINPFQTRTFLDLDIHALQHETLSDVVHVFHLDLQSCVTSSQASSQQVRGDTESASTATEDDQVLDAVFSKCKQLCITPHKSGHATAVVFWFDMTLAPGVNASTVDPEMNWKQAAFMLDGRRVEAGQELTMKAQLEKDYMHFSLV